MATVIINMFRKTMDNNLIQAINNETGMEQL